MSWEDFLQNINKRDTKVLFSLYKNNGEFPLKLGGGVGTALKVKLWLKLAAFLVPRKPDLF